MRHPLRSTFDPDPAAVAAVRRFVHDALAERVAHDTVDEIVLVASELATNAVEHARTPFEVALHTDDHLHIDVVDGSPALPIVRPWSSSAESGRGMQIVDAICDRWGVEVHEHAKRVWCEKDLG